MNFAVFHGGIGPLDTKGRGRVMAIDVPVRCAGVKSRAETSSSARADGVVVVPRAVEEQVLALAFEKIERRERPSTTCARAKSSACHVREIEYCRSSGAPFKCNQPAVRTTVQVDDSNVRIARWDFAPTRRHQLGSAIAGPTSA